LTSPKSDESWWRRFPDDRAARFKIDYDRLLPYVSGFAGELGIHENRAIRSIRTVTTMDMPKNVQPGLNPTDGRQQFPAPVAAIGPIGAIKHSVRASALTRSDPLALGKSDPPEEHVLPAGKRCRSRYHPRRRRASALYPAGSNLERQLSPHTTAQMAPRRSRFGGSLLLSKGGSFLASADGLSAEKIDALLRKWLRLLPHPFSAADRKAGFRYQVSILQAEFSLTQVLDRPVTGRVFFEEVIRENLDIGRPGQVQLIFDRRVTARTPGRFRTRVITDGVVPSLHVDYKNTRIKQYHKEGRALRTETTINNTRDFGIGKLLKNLPALRQVGFRANRRLLDVQRVSHDCAIGEDAFDKVVRPAEIEGQRASALRFGDKRVQALFAVLVVFSLQLRGFNNREMRVLLAQLLGLDPANYPIGRMTYDLRRLRLHGIIERIPRSHRYQLTADGLRIALFFSRTYARLLRPKLAEIMPRPEPTPSALRIAFDRLNAVIDACCQEEQLAA